MKISEIRNKMFNLSDLKGLINENVTLEAMNWAEFFRQNPQFLSDKYNFQNRDDFFADEELMQALANFPKSIYGYLKTPEERYALDKQTRANVFGKPSGSGGFMPNWRKFRAIRDRKQQQTQPVDAMTRLSNDGVDTFTGNESGTKLLYDFFKNNGGQNLVYSYDLESNADLAKEYVNSCFNLADEAAKYFEGTEKGAVIKFDYMGLKVGSVLDPFLLFLYFYYIKYTKWGGGNKYNQEIVLANKPRYEEFANNIEKCTTGEYAKYLANPILNAKKTGGTNQLKNVFDTILNCGKTSLKDGTICKRLNLLGLNGDELSYARSSAYLQAYQLQTGILIRNNDSIFIAKTFNYDANRLFDLLSDINESKIISGLQKISSKNLMPTLDLLTKSCLIENDKDKSPAEQIFSFVRSFRSVLDIDFKKRLGASGENVFGKQGDNIAGRIKLLLGPADVGVSMLIDDASARGYSGPKLPQTISGLNEMYKGKIMELGDDRREELRMWKLLERETDTKTQDEIYYYLLGISDPDTVWSQEYNRYKVEDAEQSENGLGRKSIDILGKKTVDGGTEKTLCFEYQGEQHYHPVNVRPSDYQYSLFTMMRDDILRSCKFSAEEVGTRKYYYSTESSELDDTRIKEIIISVFGSYASKISQYLSTTKTPNVGKKTITKGFSVPQTVALSEGSTRKNINTEGLKKINLEEVLEYFTNIASTDLTKPDSVDGIFENPPIKGLVPYLCSPCRFYDEVQTAFDVERDRVKGAVIANRAQNGWSMAYITPVVRDTNSSSFTTEDYEYTIALAKNSGAKVFQWTKEGKKEIADYLVTMGFLTPNMNNVEAGLQENKNSLFQQIIKEIFNESAQ